MQPAQHVVGRESVSALLATDEAIAAIAPANQENGSDVMFVSVQVL